MWVMILPTFKGAFPAPVLLRRLQHGLPRLTRNCCTRRTIVMPTEILVGGGGCILVYDFPTLRAKALY